MKPQRFRSATLLALALIAAITSFAVPATAQTVRVLTFNIRFDFEDDGDNRWEHRKEVVAKTMKGLAASIICLQEDKEDQVEDLAALLPEYGYVGRGRNESGSGERCSIWYHERHFGVEEWGTIWLSDTPDEPGSKTRGDRYPRIATWAVLVARRGGKKVLVVNTHLSDRGRSDNIREAQGTILHDWLAGHLGSDGRRVPVVLAGDFNSEQGSDVHETMTDSERIPMTDAWEEANGEERGGTYHGFEGGVYVKRIDWVLVRGPIRVRRAGMFTDQVDGRYPSDHYPVWADLDLR